MKLFSWIKLLFGLTTIAVGVLSLFVTPSLYVQILYGLMLGGCIGMVTAQGLFELFGRD